MKKLIYVVFALIMMACHDDIGNYEYKDLNIVTEITNIEDEYVVFQEDEPLTISPEISFLNEKMPEFEYAWRLEALTDEIVVKDTIIARTKDLSFIPGIEILATNYKCIYTVTNTETGVETKHRFKITVDSATAFGDFVLSNNAGTAYVSLAKSDGRVFDNFYRKITGKPIVGEGIALVLNSYKGTINNRVTPFNKLTLLLKNNADRGHVIDFIDYTYLHDVNRYFYSVPENDSYISKFLVEHQERNFVVFENGNCYYEDTYNYNTEQPFLDYEMPTYESVDYANEKMGIVHTQDGYFYIGGWSGMKEMRGNCLDGTTGHVNIKGEILYCFKNNSRVTSYTHSFKILMKHDDETIKEYTIKHGWSSDDIVTPDPEEWIGKDLITENTIFAKAYTEKYYYFSSGNKIYRYNFEIGVSAPELFYTFPEGSEITYLKMDTKQEKVGWSNLYRDINLMVGFTNPAASDKNGSFYRLDQYDDENSVKYDNKFYEIKDVVVKR